MKTITIESVKCYFKLYYSAHIQKDGNRRDPVNGKIINVIFILKTNIEQIVSNKSSLTIEKKGILPII